MTIRPATPEEAVQAVPLICEAIGDIARALTGAQDDAEAQRTLTLFFAQSGNRLSYENALVADADGQVVGVLVCYDGSRAEALDRPYALRLRAQTGDPTAAVEAETGPGEFYLDTLAVRADFRRQGIATELFQAFEARAVALGHAQLSLLVEDDNTSARGLYESLGYQAGGTVRLGGHEFSRLVKFLDSAL